MPKLAITCILLKSPMAPVVGAASNQSQVTQRRRAAVVYGLLEDLENGVHKALLLKTVLLLNFNMLQLENGFIVINFIHRCPISKKLVVLVLIKIQIQGMSGKCSGMRKRHIGKEMPLLGKK